MSTQTTNYRGTYLWTRRYCSWAESRAAASANEFCAPITVRRNGFRSSRFTLATNPRTRPRVRSPASHRRRLDAPPSSAASPNRSTPTLIPRNVTQERGGSRPLVRRKTCLCSSPRHCHQCVRRPAAPANHDITAALAVHTSPRHTGAATQHTPSAHPPMPKSRCHPRRRHRHPLLRVRHLPPLVFRRPQHCRRSELSVHGLGARASPSTVSLRAGGRIAASGKIPRRRGRGGCSARTTLGRRERAKDARVGIDRVLGASCARPYRRRRARRTRASCARCGWTSRTAER
ncbi:hypothetical protein B0H13DRAFT_1963536 [Mycena leptocephala]|nr:hypothetical protein B0H13DRAFT_1963536 [Mycena leptocephala]